MATHIRLRRFTAAEWTAANPVLLDSEPGWERDTKKLKIGDGVTAWNALPYFAGGTGASGDVKTVEFFTQPGGTAVVGNAYLPFQKLDVGATGDDLLDLTDPTQPLIVAAGHYIFNLAISALDGPYPDPLEFFWYGLDVTRPDGWSAYQDNVFPLVMGPGGRNPVGSQSLGFYCPVGTRVTAEVKTPFDTGFELEGSVQRTSGPIA